MFPLFAQEETWYDPALLEAAFSRFPESHRRSHHNNNNNNELEEEEEEDEMALRKAPPTRDDRLPSSDGDFSLGSSDEEEEAASGAKAGGEDGEVEEKSSVLVSSPNSNHSRQHRTRTKSSRHSSQSSAAAASMRHLLPVGRGGSAARCQPDLRASDSPATSIPVRKGPAYSVHRKKAPSAVSLYEFRSMDVVSSETKKLGDLKQVLGDKFDLGEISKEKRATAERLGLPCFMVVNIQIPNRAPMSSMFKNDFGTSLVLVFELRSEVQTPDASTMLVSKFVKGQVKGRFKIIGFLDNQQELGLPTFVSMLLPKFNGVPVMINKTGSFRAMGEYFQVDIDIHAFPTATRQCLSTVRSMGKHIAFRFAFLVQGEADEELPERILGVAAIKGLDFESSESV